MKEITWISANNKWTIKARAEPNGTIHGTIHDYPYFTYRWQSQTTINQDCFDLWDIPRYIQRKLHRIIRQLKGDTPMKKGWKATRLYENRHYSVIMTQDRKVLYELNSPTKRPKDGGPLTLFATKQQAQAFLGAHATFNHLYKTSPCDYTPSADTLVWHADQRRFDHLLPLGTLFADDITLREE